MCGVWCGVAAIIWRPKLAATSALRWFSLQYMIPHKAWYRELKVHKQINMGKAREKIVSDRSVTAGNIVSLSTHASVRRYVLLAKP